MENGIYFSYTMFMTEYEKMIAGLTYDPKDAFLSERRWHARDLLNEINQSVQPIKDDARSLLCKKLFGAYGLNLWLQPPFYCDYGINIVLGNDVFINFNCIFLDVAKITIGDSVQIGPNVQIYTAAHPLEWQKRRDGEEHGKPIIVENDVWIGGGVIICPGVTIWAGSVIGAGAVVTKDVPPHVLIAGNPGKVIKQL